MCRTFTSSGSERRSAALHALNAALGGPVFTQEDIDCAAQRVLDCAIAAAMNNTESCEETLARHRSPAGMYSEQALGEALAHDGRWRMDDQSWYLPPVDALALMPRDDIVGAIAYTPGHWVALRTVDGGLWLLDSLKRWPQRPGSVGDPAAKAFLESCERVFLLCSDQGVAPTNQELTERSGNGGGFAPVASAAGGSNIEGTAARLSVEVASPRACALRPCSSSGPARWRTRRQIACGTASTGVCVRRRRPPLPAELASCASRRRSFDAGALVAPVGSWPRWLGREQARRCRSTASLHSALADHSLSSCRPV